jgi:hypothetical protein
MPSRPVCRAHLGCDYASQSTPAVVCLMAYVLLRALRRIGLYHTAFADPTCGTIRLNLLKIGALVGVSVRRIKVAMASGCPAAAVWMLPASRLAAASRAPPMRKSLAAARNTRGVIIKPTKTAHSIPKAPILTRSWRDGSPCSPFNMSRASRQNANVLQ